MIERITPEMEKRVSEDLASLVSGKFTYVEGCFIPAGPRAEHQGLHLIVNCRCSESFFTMSPEIVLREIRSALPDLIRRITAFEWWGRAQSVWIKFYFPKSPNRPPWHVAVGIRRLYSYAILRRDISEGAISENLIFGRGKQTETSEVECISELLTNNAAAESSNKGE